VLLLLSAVPMLQVLQSEQTRLARGVLRLLGRGQRKHQEDPVPIPRLCFERSKPSQSSRFDLSGECGPCFGLSGLKPDSSRTNALFAKLVYSGGCEGYITLDISPTWIFLGMQNLAQGCS
jgi:hypothetical protein